MSVKFCIASGVARTSQSCGMDVPTELAETPVQLSTMGRPEYNTHSQRFLRKRVKVAEEMSNDVPDIWRGRIICTLAPIESVFCISFIPADPFIPQTLLVMRMKDVDATAESYPVFCFDLPAYKFMLPQKRADQVFDISKLSIDETLGQFDHSLTPIFKKVLGYLTQEKKLKGMALTLKNEEEALYTSIWLK